MTDDDEVDVEQSVPLEVRYAAMVWLVGELRESRNTWRAFAIFAVVVQVGTVIWRTVAA